MDGRSFPDFTNTLEWNLLSRATYQAQQLTDNTYRPLAPRSFFVENSNVLILGVSSEGATATWKTGGWARQVLPFLPSSTSNFTAAVHVERRWLRLGTLTLAVFPKLLDAWILQVDFPYWLNNASLEIWRYDGQDVSAFDRFDRVDSEIAALPV